MVMIRLGCFRRHFFTVKPGVISSTEQREPAAVRADASGQSANLRRQMRIGVKRAAMSKNFCLSLVSNFLLFPSFSLFLKSSFQFPVTNDFAPVKAKVATVLRRLAPRSRCCN